MIYITEDCHGNFELFNTRIIPEHKEMDKDDYCIITGDFGAHPVPRRSLAEACINRIDLRRILKRSASIRRSRNGSSGTIMRI